MKTVTYEEFLQEQLSDSEFRREYDETEEEFTIAREVIELRRTELHRRRWKPGGNSRKRPIECHRVKVQRMVCITSKLSRLGPLPVQQRFREMHLQRLNLYDKVTYGPSLLERYAKRHLSQPRSHRPGIGSKAGD